MASALTCVTGGQTSLTDLALRNQSYIVCMYGVQRVLDKGVLRKRFGTKSDEVKGEWRRLQKEELYDPHTSPNIIRVMTSRM